MFWRTFTAPLFLFVVLARAYPQPADESGTLVMAALVNNAVIISVDSKISVNGDPRGFLSVPTSAIDSTRKLIAVGSASACAISGYLGTIGTGLNVTPALREWVSVHPKVEAVEALPDLLDLVIEVWKKHRYKPNALPRGRKFGDNITTLVCGISKGETRLVWGRTVVGKDGNALAVMRPDDWHGLLYVCGIIPTTVEFSNLAANPNYKSFDYHLNLIAVDVRSELQRDKRNVDSYNAWIRAQEAATASAGRGSSFSPIEDWNLDNAKLLFALVFHAVEKNVEEEVAPLTCPLFLIHS